MPQENLEDLKKRLGIDEDSLRVLTNNKDLANMVSNDAPFTDLGIKFTNRQMVVLKLLSYHFPDDVDLWLQRCEESSELEKNVVKDFLKDIKGDMKFNAELRKIIYSSDKEYDNLDKDVLKLLVTYTYKTRNFKVFSHALGKLNNIYGNVVNGIELPDIDKISLVEYASVADVASGSLAPVIKQFTDNGFVDTNDEYNYNNIDKATKTIELINQKCCDSRDNATKPGTIVFADLKKWCLALGRCLSFFQKLITIFVSKYSHVSKMYDVEGRRTISHINPTPDNDDNFKLLDYLYSDIYRINVGSLISEKQKNKLREHLGERWLDEVERMYACIERAIHDNTAEKFSGIEAHAQNTTEQYKACWPSILPFALGHKQFRKNDFMKIHDYVYSDFYKNGKHKMLCSEFIANTTIAALVELDKQLKEKIKSEFNDIIEDQIIKIPVGSHESLNTLDSERFLKVLKSYGCIEQVKKPEYITNFIKV